MRTINIFLIIVLLIMYSCKENKDTPFLEPKKNFFFHGFVDGVETTFIGYHNGYKIFTWDTCLYEGFNTEWNAVTMFFQDSLDYAFRKHEGLIFKIHKFVNDTLDRDSVITAYFKGPLTYAVGDKMTGEITKPGVELIFIDAKKNAYTTLYTSQSSNITVTNFEMKVYDNERILVFDITFNCTLINPLTDQLIKITDAKARLQTYSQCF